MGLITSILDALRRIGSPRQKSALRRQDEFLENKGVLERRREGDRFVVTVEPFQETVEPISEVDLRPILENAALVTQFMSRFGVTPSIPWTIEELDAAYTTWSASEDRRGYNDEAVMEIFGAAFGQRCVEQFDMQWVKITDVDGAALGIQGIVKDFRAFPYDSISKRIADGECGFFSPIYSGIGDAAEQDWHPTGAA
jgi:hypothetical protein